MNRSCFLVFVFPYDDDDMLTEIKIGSTVVKSFGYDGAGRRTSATYSGVTTNYAYDYESRITSITRTGVTTNSFAYNGLDTRVSKTDSAGTTSYKRAGAYVTDSLLKSTVSSTTTDYTPGVSSRVGSDSTFLHSGIKNADTQTDDGGDVSAMRRYDAFGNPLAAWGGWQGPFGYGGPYGYQTDPDHGLMLLGHRYYEADTGRFLTRDPIKDGRNWYGYCGNGPLRSADPDGKVEVRVVSYRVLGPGWHRGIVVVDNMGTNRAHSFAGGPEKYGIRDNGNLVSRSGPWKKGTQDFDEYRRRMDRGLQDAVLVITLVNDSSPYQDWIDKFTAIENEIKRHAAKPYEALPGDGRVRWYFGPGGPIPFPHNPSANSNTWFMYLINKSGLREPYDRAGRKIGGLPNAPGDTIAHPFKF